MPRPFPPLWKIVMLVVLWLGGALSLGAGLLNHLGEAMMATVTASEQKLVYQTNHQQILEACAWIKANPDKLGIQRDRQEFSIGGPGSGLPVNMSLPAALRDLDFEAIEVTPTNVEIWFGGGFYHWGFMATSVAPRITVGHWQLIPGLLYWNEGNRFPPDPSKPPLPHASTKWFLASAAMIVCAIAIGFIRPKSGPRVLDSPVP